MQLNAWRRLRNKSLWDVVHMMGDCVSNAGQVSKHERGVHFPRPAIIDRYREITEGAVTEADWLHLARERAAQPPTTTETKEEACHG